MDDNYFPNVKVFQNGNIQMTGARKIDDIWIPLNNIFEQIKNIFSFDKNILPDIDDISSLTMSNFKIQMINTDFKLFKDPDMKEKFNVKRKELHRILTHNYDVISRYDAATYPGVKTEFWWNKDTTERNGYKFLDKRGIKGGDTSIYKKITIAVFESGSVLITGAVNTSQVDDAYSFITNVIKDNEDAISMNNINSS